MGGLGMAVQTFTVVGTDQSQSQNQSQRRCTVGHLMAKSMTMASYLIATKGGYGSAPWENGKIWVDVTDGDVLARHQHLRRLQCHRLRRSRRRRHRQLRPTGAWQTAIALGLGVWSPSPILDLDMLHEAVPRRYTLEEGFFFLLLTSTVV